MRRRTFLKAAAALAAVTQLQPGARSLLASGPTRSQHWPWQSGDVLQWRYLAGRMTLAGQDTGIIVSISRRLNSNFSYSYDLLVERQALPSGTFAAKTYSGTTSYDATSATYSFANSDSSATASWQYDAAADGYKLSVTTAELTLTNLTLTPQSDLIPEGGGTISVGKFYDVRFSSDYHADWVAVSSAGTPIGSARLDMQGVFPAEFNSPDLSQNDYDHHWFAIDAVQAGQPVRVSCWRIETADAPVWCVTVAQPGVATVSYTSDSPAVQPLTVTPLTFQPQPSPSTLVTGSTWHISCGIVANGDLLDLVVGNGIPLGQFAPARQSSVSGTNYLLESIGAGVRGTVRRRPLTSHAFVVAESSVELPADTPPVAPPSLVTTAVYLPGLTK